MHPRGMQGAADSCNHQTPKPPSLKYVLLQGTRARCLAAEQRCQELQGSLRTHDDERADLQARLQVKACMRAPMYLHSAAAWLPSCRHRQCNKYHFRTKA